MNTPDNIAVKINIDAVVKETQKAFLYNIRGHEYWVPRSVIQEYNHSTKPIDSISKIAVSRYAKIEKWWLDKNQIIY